MFKFIKKQMFGGEVKETLGELQGEKISSVTTKLKIHRIEGKQGEKLIGLETIASSILSHHMLPITLSEQNARELKEILNRI